MEISKGKVNKAKLMDDVSELIDQYTTSKSLTDLDLGGLMGDLTDLMNRHQLSVPGEYTMLIRALVTIEGVLEEFCPELGLFSLVMKKLVQRAKENFDIRSQFTSILENLTSTGLRTVRLPNMAFDVLRNLVKGRIKIGLELTGYEELVEKLNATVKNVILAVFACVLFGGSCTLCTTNIQPQTNGIPLVAMIGFVVSVALGLYTIRSMIKK